jgi:putative membrane protein
MLLWWPIVSAVSQLPRLAPGFQVLYLVALAIGQIPVFAYVTFSSTVLYPTYEMAPRIVPLTPLEDQQLGGILMHTVGMGVLFTTLVVVFQKWNHAESVSQTSDESPPAPRLFLG